MKERKTKSDLSNDNLPYEVEELNLAEWVSSNPSKSALPDESITSVTNGSENSIRSPSIASVTPNQSSENFNGESLGNRNRELINMDESDITV